MQSRVHSSAGFVSELGKICGPISMQKYMTYSLLFHVDSYRLTSVNEILIAPALEAKKNGQVWPEISTPHFRGETKRRDVY